MTVTLEESPDLEMPPANVVKCRCDQNICPMSGPCPLEATDDDMLCDPCREAEKNAKALHDGVYGTGLIYAIRSFRRRGTSMGHCHACDPEYYNKGDGNGNSGGPA